MIATATVTTKSVPSACHNLSAIGFHPPSKKQAATNAMIAYRPQKMTKIAAPAVSLSLEIPQLRTADAETATIQIANAAPAELMPSENESDYRLI